MGSVYLNRKMLSAAEIRLHPKSSYCFPFSLVPFWCVDYFGGGPSCRLAPSISVPCRLSRQQACFSH